jgi:CHAT domain-containing protein
MLDCFHLASRGRALMLAVLLLGLLAAGSADAQGRGRGRGGEAGGGQLRELMDQAEQAIKDKEFAAAEDAARKALAIAEPRGNQRALAQIYGDLGAIYKVRGRYADAASLLSKALPMIEAEFGADSRKTLRTMTQLGDTLRAMGRYGEADRVLRARLERQTELSRPGDRRLTSALAHYAILQRVVGQYARSEELFKKAIANAAEAAQPQHLKVAASAHRAYAQMLRDLRRYAEAETEARTAVSLFGRVYGPEHGEVARALVQLGESLRALRRLDEAEAALRRSLLISEKFYGKSHSEVAQALTSLANVLDARGDTDAADAAYRRGIEIARLSSTQLQLLRQSNAYARFLQRLGRDEQALPYFRQSLDLIEAGFAATRDLDEETREDFASHYASIYYRTVHSLLRLHRVQPQAGYDRETLAVVSRTQSRLFTEMLRQADVNRFSADPRFNTLKRDYDERGRDAADLRRARNLAFRSADPDDDEEDEKIDPLVKARIERRRAEFDQRVEAADRERKAAEEQLWREYPRFMELTQPRPVTAEVLQQRLLRPDETLLSYFVQPDAVVIWVVSRNEFHMRVLPQERGQLLQLVRQARRAEEQAATSIARLSDLDPGVLNQLYKLLILPVEQWLPQGKTILVAGDSTLLTLPLEMLVPRWNEEDRRRFAAERAANRLLLNEYATLSYLGQRYRFAYLPSLSALASQRQFAKTGPAYDREFVSFADPAFGNESGTYGEATRALLQTLAGSARSGQRISIPRLPETADEAREIAHVLGGKSDLFLRADAQEKTVKTLDLKRTRFLHFATHGLLGGEFLLVKQSNTDEEEGGARDNQRNLGVAAASAPQPAAPPTERPRSGGQPALVLSLVGELQGEDGLLTMREVIEDLDLNAQLVVLSACNTAGESDNAYNGEGFAGLTRAFMYAGARGLLVSHWAVESISTQALITDTFRNLKQGEPLLAALGKAREFIRSTPGEGGGRSYSRAHPYFWAPFVYVGD